MTRRRYKHTPNGFGVSININHTGDLRRQLMAEITDLERQLNQLRFTGQSVDLSLMRSYTELIDSRRAYLQTLPVSWCW